MGALRIAIAHAAPEPLYQQVKDQIAGAIARGDLVEGDRLPSVRALARDLRVSVITTTRAYTDLAAEGLVTNVHGKGNFVRGHTSELAQAHAREDVREHLSAAVQAARRGGLPDESVVELLEETLTAQHKHLSPRTTAPDPATAGEVTEVLVPTRPEGPADSTQPIEETPWPATRP